MGWLVPVIIPTVGSIALFSFLAVAVWASERRQERESYYRYEFRKKLVESGEMNATHVQDLMRFEFESQNWRRRQGMIAGGFITAGVGVGLVFGLRFIEDESVWMVGYIPMFIGLAMLGYALFLAPKGMPVPPKGTMPPTPNAE